MLQQTSKFYWYLPCNNDVTVNAKEMSVGVTLGVQCIHLTALRQYFKS